MSMPVILGLVNGVPIEETDFVRMLAEATEHLDININPDGTWLEAEARLRMIGQISEQRNGKASRSFIIPKPQGMSFSPRTTTITGLAELYVLRFHWNPTAQINLSFGTERFGGDKWMTP